MGHAASSTEVYRFGLFEADAGRGTLSRNGLRVKIQDQPFRVLVLLLRRNGEIVTREELRQHLWPEGTYVDFDGSLNVILKRLRATIDDDPENPRFVETVPRRGYRFIAPVSVQVVAGEEPSRQPASQGLREAVSEAVPPNAQQIRRSRLLLYVCSGFVLILITALALFRSGRNQVMEKATGLHSTLAPSAIRKSVAVLGFHNVSGQMDNAWLGTALSEMLSTELAGGEKLRLISGEDVANLRVTSPWPQTYTLDEATTARIGLALNSDMLVLGSYTTIGKRDRGQLRLDVRLQDARTGEILTEIAEIGSADSLFQMVSRVGQKLRDRLGVPRLDDADEIGIISALPRDPEAARLYSLGVAKLRRFEASAARDLLEQAVQADPKFPFAHVMLARALSQLGYEQKRREEAKKAFDLSARLTRPERMQVEADYYESLADHEKAASIYNALFQSFPDNVEYGLLYAQTQAAAGHASQALETLHQLRRLPAPFCNDPRIDIVEAKNVVSKIEALKLLHTALSKASLEGKKLIYAQARRDECMNLTYGSNPEQGSSACDEAYRIFLAAGNRLGAADSLRLLADGQATQGHFDQAIAMYQQAIQTLDGMGEHEKTGAILNNMAIAYLSQGKLVQGEQLYKRAKAHFEAAGDRYNATTLMANIADVLYMRGDLPGATRQYDEALQMEATLDPSKPGYILYRIADLELARGRVLDAQRRAQDAIASISSEHGNYEGLSSAMIVLGEVLEAKGDFEGAGQQYEKALTMRQQMGAMDLVSENQQAIAELYLQQGHPDQAEPLLRIAIAEFEKEKASPDASSGYTLLSRVLLALGRVDEARRSIEQAAKFSIDNPDPAIRLPIAIQKVRVLSASANFGTPGNSAAAARKELQTVESTAKKLGYYNLECEARLTLGELGLHSDPAMARSQLTSLAAEVRSRGLEMIARRAERLLSGTASELAAAHPVH